MLAQERLVEADGAVLEGHGRARQVQEPGAIGPLAHERARLVRARGQPLDPVAAGARVVQPEVLDVHDLPVGALHLGERLAHPRHVAVGEDVAQEELGLAGALPVKLVLDAVAQVEAPVAQQLADAAEERGVVLDPHVLDHADGRHLVVARVTRHVPEVAVLDHAAVGQALALDARLRPRRLLAREGHAVRAHAVVLGGPDRQRAPAAADVEHGLAGREPELPAHEVELVHLRLLELAVRVAVVGARVDHQRVEEQRVEVVADVVMVRDRLRVPLLLPLAHDVASRMPKMAPNTTRRRAALEPRTTRTAARVTASGSFATCRPTQPRSPTP